MIDQWSAPTDDTVEQLCWRAYELGIRKPSKQEDMIEVQDKLHVNNIRLLLHVRQSLKPTKNRDRALNSILNLRQQITSAVHLKIADEEIRKASQI